MLDRVLFHHFGKFLSEYEGRFEKECGFLRPVVKEVVERYLDCGNPRCGFALMERWIFFKDYATYLLLPVVFLSAVAEWEIDTKSKTRAAAAEKEILILMSAMTNALALVVFLPRAHLTFTNRRVLIRKPVTLSLVA